MSVAFYQRTCAKLRDKSKPKRFSFWFWAQSWLAFSTKIFVLSVLLSVAVYGFSLFWHLVFSFQFSATTQAVFRFPIHAIRFSVSSSSVYMPWHDWEECMTNLNDLIGWLHFSNRIMPWTMALQRVIEGTGAKNDWEWKSWGNCGLYRFLMKRVKEGRILGRGTNSGVNSTRKSEACKSLRTLFGKSVELIS